MKRNDFIENYTEDYNDALKDAIKMAKQCSLFSLDDLTTGWRVTAPYNKDQNIVDMDASELECVYTHMQDIISDLEKFANHISEMATAKNELESVDLYEFDDDGAV